LQALNLHPYGVAQHRSFRFIDCYATLSEVYMTTTPTKDSSNKNAASKSTPAAKSTVPAKTTKKASTGESRVNSSNIGLWLIGASVAIVAIVVGIIIFNENQAKSAPVAQPDVPAEWINRNVVGSPDAPVTVQLWEDFLCPSCQSFATTVKPQLFANDVKSGKVRVEYHYFPLQQHEPGATMSALAAECAADQGMFWPYHDRVFQMAKVDQQGAVQFDDLVGYAQGMGMDEARFRSCLSSQEHLSTVTDSLAQAQQLNLQFTPSVIVGDTLLQDSSYASVSAEVERQVAAAQ
jgi:protein-disulfide isomerase